MSENAPKATQSLNPATYDPRETIQVWILRKDGTTLRQVESPIAYGTGRQWVTYMGKSFSFEYVPPGDVAGVIVGVNGKLLATEATLAPK